MWFIPWLKIFVTMKKMNNMKVSMIHNSLFLKLKLQKKKKIFIWNLKIVPVIKILLWQRKHEYVVTFKWHKFCFNFNVNNCRFCIFQHIFLLKKLKEHFKFVNCSAGVSFDVITKDVRRCSKYLSVGQKNNHWLEYVVKWFGNHFYLISHIQIIHLLTIFHWHQLLKNFDIEK